MSSCRFGARESRSLIVSTLTARDGLRLLWGGVGEGEIIFLWALLDDDKKLIFSPKFNRNHVL